MIFFFCAFLLLRIIFWWFAFPNSDEAYYWLWGQHFDWSYYDHPPLEAWIQGLCTSLFGRSAFVLRLPNLFSNVAFFYTYYRIVIYLHKNLEFWKVMLLVVSSPLYFIFLGFAWHDHLLITASLISAYLLIRFLDTYLTDGRGETWRLYASAIALSFAFLSKYNAIFVAIGFFATVITEARLRPLFRDRRLYIAIAIALTALIPIIIWNVSNDFLSFRYYVDRSVRPVDPGIKIGPFLGFTLVSLFVVPPFSWIGFYQLLKTRLPIQSIYPTVAFWVFVPSTIGLTIISLVSAALYYWNITAYLLLFPLLPFVFRNFKAQAIYGLIISAVLVFHYTVFPLTALIDQQSDPDSRMLFGWKEVAAIVESEARTLNAPLLVTSDYRSASALAYQMNNRNVIAISDRIDQFDFWHRNLPDGKDAVIVSDDWYPAELVVLSKFDRTSEPITISVKRFGVWIKNYYVRKGYGLKS
ncbi:dolichyl-phosphate-mannose-protein mannosyltransferase [Leptolyngbya boryana NIES-2135]|jgi:4-amino-4-deoxy-L-arabinose transferase-like glycosyltransferase|uniref:Dolichyl-phosphate-mannose-protein mannosyltransferase n=1 Tax=Leptolyngbya boryana NIES-2135 TaxID=1973484 RepID=A0A1Z4JC55_LEPBY|nr:MULTISPECIES: glycosyltransferase family 39 protein [Leptolyngbya]BAY54273.1 dolichyl-phosphate-mannose-protein mannosyltransferase [Leptolyngbya boryana NIES-2135]MBD2370858.1 glycosyltransferase family 39 protein [Leptolyngbya sp. FACHB-161]MBD2377144.1 glycosyltransferase family 39 protein [Leptolyngbya sp. FACHB-238]MBD2401646.1 glycosyltransferase family 39 protein [Leptolyngbya sp. FACHB-239]MBD2408199.1 glycosyltransferase family 39 protein [Leptolyngbya sp. FACHB-402]